MPKTDDKTAADILAHVGRAIFPGDNWQARLAVALGVRRDTIRQWLHGHVPFGPNHGAFNDLLALVAQRESELHTTKDELQTWLKRNRD
jgi:hypothetical protein